MLKDIFATQRDSLKLMITLVSNDISGTSIYVHLIVLERVCFKITVELQMFIKLIFSLH